MSRFKELMYQRGYLITNEDVKAPQDHWELFKINEYKVFYDPLNMIEFAKMGDHWVFILGNVIDLDNRTNDMSFIVEQLLEKLKLTSPNDFFDYLDVLSGRYLIFYSDGKTTNIMSDATGMRTIFYSQNRMFIGSHCMLIQDYIQSSESKTVQRSWLSEYTSQLLPGHYTPYEDVFFLTPNTLLELESIRIKRFFPRENLEQQPIDKVVSEISELAKTQIMLLSNNYKLLLSLTAGLDSRTTLAFTRECKELFEYFTYFKSSYNKSLDIDQNIAKQLASNLGLNHSFIKIDQEMNDSEFGELTKILRKNTFSSHAFKLAGIYLSKFSEKNHLHIRSNLYEIGRMYFRSHIKNLPKDFTTEGMVKVYSQKALDDSRVASAFEKYYNVVEMENSYNYDPYDLFYWEYRMGTWHAQLLLESDIAHDTFILFNSRKILKLLLSVSEDEKKENLVFYKLISENWQVLDYWQINSLLKVSDNYDSQIDDFGITLKNLEFTSGSMKLPNRKVPINSTVYSKKFKFNIDLRAPHGGDYAEVKVPLQVQKSKGNYCMLQIRSPYEKRTNSGRIHYEILHDNQLILSEDIANWKESNQILIKWIPEENVSWLTIRLVSDKNCENWNWGKIATLIVERISCGKVDNLTEKQIIASSPYSDIFQ